jgi:hypothetical protein
VYPSNFGSFHQTTMSMSAMFTGRVPSLETPDPKRPMPMTGRTYCGMARFHGREPDEQCIPGSLRTLGEVMKDSNYETIGVVSNALLFRPFGLDQGFDEWIEVGEDRVPRNPKQRQTLMRVYASRSGSAVNTAVKDALARRTSDRFFLYVHYMEVHDYSGGRRAYAKAVGKADWMIADLLHTLEKEGLSDGTTFVFASDHGERLGEKHLVPGTKGHEGNPSFAEVLRIPLIISPAPKDDRGEGLVRTADLYRILAGLAGAEVHEDETLGDDEIYLSETLWQTYQRGRWKSFVRRSDDRLFLVDLLRDAGETRDVSSLHPKIAARHRRRIAAIAKSLSKSFDTAPVLTEKDEERLRALGYVE